MNLYGFFRLFWRPASIFIVWYMSWICSMFLNLYASISSDTHYGFFDPRGIENALPFFLAVAPFFCGHVIVQYVTELLNTRLSWTLPNVRSLLFWGTLALALAVALIVTMVYRSYDGLMPPVPAFVVTLFWFSVGGSIPYMLGKGIPRRLRWMNWLAYFALILGAFLADHLVQFGQAHPYLLSVLGLLGAALFWHMTFGAETWRARVANPTLSVFNVFSPGKAWGYRREMRARRVEKGTEWNIGYLNDRLWNWIRAAAYERCGHSRRGWLGGTLLCSGAALVFILGISALNNLSDLLHQRMDTHRLVQSIYEVVIFPGYASDMGFPALPFCLGMASFWYLFYFEIFLCRSSTRGLIYPLSRARQARLAFWGSLAQNGLFCVVTGCLFVVVGLAAHHLGDLDVSWPTAPAFVRPLLLLFLILPLGQWFLFRYGAFMEAGNRFLWSVMPVMVLGLFFIMYKFGPSGENQVVMLLVGFFAVQGLYYLSIRRYFKVRDLTV